MSILFRYILREHIAPFFFSLGLIIFIFVLNLVFQMLGRIADKGLPLATIFEFFFLNLAWMIALAVPMAVLVATVASFGRMAAEHEITALKACGIGPIRLLLPPLVASVLVAAFLVEFQNEILPIMNHRSRILQSDIHRKRPTMVLEAGVFLFDIPGYVLYAREIDPRTSRMGDIVVYDENDPEWYTTITARRGFLEYDSVEAGFLFMLTDGEIGRASKVKPEEYQRTQFERAMFRVKAPGTLLERTDSQWRSDREMNLRQMYETARSLQKDPVKNRKQLAGYWVEINKKFSISVACIIFVLLGVPLGISAQRGGLGVAAGFSIFFFLIYWVFLIGGEDLAERGFLGPAVAMWSPNVLMGALGLFLLWRQTRSALAIPWDKVLKIFRRNTPTS
jgi:lipopolysaccharide export system permease protein